MSEILIRDIEMPKDRPLIIKISPDGTVYMSQGIYGIGHGVATAVPIPPHGDLIDRNVLYHNMFIGPDERVFPDRDVDNFPHEMRFEDIKRFIRKAQTVIQASE